MESKLGSGSSEQSKMHIESSHDDGYAITEQKMSRSSSSSSSSSSPFDSLADLEDGEQDNLDNSMTKSGQFSPGSPRAGIITSHHFSASTPEWSTASASPRVGLEHASHNFSASTPEWSMASASPRVGLEHAPQTPEWSMMTASPKQSPPIQTMGRPLAGYDPSRIPSSIFSSKPATPMDWSVASNESLFSIQMGNNSFTKDHVFLFNRSGELAKPDDSSYFGPSQRPGIETKSNGLNHSPSNLPTVIEAAVDNDEKSASVKEEAGEMPRVAVKETADNHSKSMAPVDSARISGGTPRLSDDSGKSFAFPILTSEAGRGTAKVSPDNVQSRPPEKPKPETEPKTKPKPKLEAEPEPVNPKAAETSWFSCFSCCPAALTHT